MNRIWFPVLKGVLFGAAISILIREMPPRWRLPSMILIWISATGYGIKMMYDTRQLKKKWEDDDLLYKSWEELSPEEKYKRMEP
jgi:hypothetical protein